MSLPLDASTRPPAKDLPPETVCVECGHPKREHPLRCTHRTPVIMDLLGLPAHPANPVVGSVGCPCPGFR